MPSGSFTRPSPEDELSFKIEIKSCHDLVSADRNGLSDPYVKIKVGSTEYHKTKHIVKTLNPVFSAAEHNNTYILNIPAKELYNEDGITIVVKDWDRIGKNEDIGFVTFRADRVLEWAAAATITPAAATTNVPLEIPTKFQNESNANTSGSITLSIQHASDDDRALHGKNKLGTTYWMPRKQDVVTTTPKEPELVAEKPVTPVPVKKEEKIEVPAPAPAPASAPIQPKAKEEEKVVVEEAIHPKPGERLKVKVEIMSCQNLLSADRNGKSDPYVKARLGDKDIHKTKHILKTLNPVFDEHTHHSTFILDCTVEELVQLGGLQLSVKDWDRGLGGNDPLGDAMVPVSHLYHATQSSWDTPKEYTIVPPEDHKDVSTAGTVTIRYRPVQEGEEKVKVVKDNKNTRTASGSFMVPGEDKEIMIEIVSCQNLLAADNTGLSDPYVKIKLGSTTLHKTKHVDKTLNPAFGAEHHNFTILDAKKKVDLFQAKGLEFQVIDWDRGIGGNDNLGSVVVSAETIYAITTEETLKLKLNPPKGSSDDAGYLTIRLRLATLGDKEDFKKSKSFLGIAPKVFSAPAKDVPIVDAQKLVDIEDKILRLEILSCRELLAADKTGASDPYVKIKLGDKELHKTKHILKTLNPVFTEEANNSYVLDVPAMTLYTERGIRLKVKDWDRGIGGDDDLGSVIIPADTLYNFGSEPQEFKLDPPSGKSDKAGYVTIDCRAITAAEKESQKKKGLFQKVLGGVGGPKTTTRELEFSDLSLLIEIVSCQNLIKSDINTSDPYVKVVKNGEDVHKTKVITGTIDPIFTVMTGSVFILDVVKTEFSDSEGLLFKVKDYDTVGRNDELGQVQIPGKTLCEAKGERMTFTLVPPEGSKHSAAGVLNLRCRPATNYDRKFLEYASAVAAGKEKGGGNFLNIGRNMDLLMNPSGGSSDLIKGKLSMVEKTGPDAGVKKYRVRPGPDPERAAVTKWLSKEEIETESFKPSRKWIDVGSGNLGKVYVEIIAADGLPNLDTSVRGKDKTDSFAMIVYEDCCAKTDIIDDCLSPRWLPWMQRAFVFNIDHTSSDIYLGIFDHDGALSGHHDLIGRFPVNLSSLREKTDYLLSYPLHLDSVNPDRSPRGTMTVRVRVEYPSPRQLVLSNLRVPPQQYINVKNKKDLKLVRKVVDGNTDLQNFSTGTLGLYVSELTSYLYVQYYLLDAVESLLFWRGQVPLPFLSRFRIPLHSMIAFYAAITVVERPYRAIAYFWLGHAWLLLAIQSFRNNTPHPWNRTKTFGQILMMLLLNKAMVGPETIPEHYSEDEAKEYEELMKERIAKAEAAAEKRKEEELKILAEHEKQMAELDQEADTDISSKKESLSLSPLKKVLYPIQKILAMVCSGLRVVKNIYTWEEPYFAFYLTLASLLIGLVCFVVPWAFLIRWTSRIVAWVVFGPHMKLVDMFYYSKLQDATEEEEKKQLSVYYAAQRTLAQANATLAFEQTEDATKLKAIKKILYGQWVARVPVIKNERLQDLPLHSSSAKPQEQPTSEDITATRAIPVRIGGQELVGTMIPKLREIEDAQKGAVKDKDE